MWAGGSGAEQIPKQVLDQVLNAGQFSLDLARFLAPCTPLALLDLECTAISEAGNQARATPVSPRGKVSTRFRLKLANSSRWQATGEWEIDWEQVDTSSSKASATGPAQAGSSTNWKIVGWRPLEMTSVEASAAAFTDVTASAFGQDPSYAAHLLRDTNYWRAVLDEAAGVDIFGNCGVSVGDIDGDGRDEIYLCQPQGLPNRLFRQSKPGVFEDIAPHAGVDILDATSMALFADLLNRGRQDLILITQSAPLLFRNDGHGKFTWARDAFPPPPQQASLTGAALGDYDRDGFLDLYVCAYGYFQGQGAAPIPCPYYDAQNGPPNLAYRNRGDGTFVDVTTASGLDHGNNRFSFACVWADVDDDGWLDLCVVNDFGRNQLYHNRGDGTFEEIADGLPGYGAGMSAAFADLDGDGFGELYAAGMWQPVGERVTGDLEFQQRFADIGPEPVRQFAMGSNLYRPLKIGSGAAPLGQGAERRSAVQARMEAVPDAAGARWAYWNWCSDAFDLENDGWLDLYCLNGFLSSPTPDLPSVDAYLWEEVIALSPHNDMPTAEYRAAWAASFELAHRGHPWDGLQRNVFFLNLGAGGFVDASATTGLDYPFDSRSFAVFDYDGDGDADIVTHGRTGPQLRLLRNEIGHQNRSLAIRLTGTHSNRDAIGAKIEVETPTGRRVRYLSCGSGFVSQHSKELVFGLGSNSGASSVRVRWPNGKVSEYQHLEAGYRYYLVEGTSARTPELRREALPRESSGNSGSARRGSGFGVRDSRKADPGSPFSSANPEPPNPKPVLPATIPARFSTTLVDPVLVPALEAFKDLNAPGNHGAGSLRSEPSYRLLWLWDPAEPNRTGLESFLRVQREVPSRLALWGESPRSFNSSPEMLSPPWPADPRFRRFVSTVLAYLYDYRRQPVLPTGLLFDSPGVEGGAEGASASARARLVKIYWGGADADEILRDVRQPMPSGVEALPFPGRALLCSFQRDARALGAALASAGLSAESEPFLEQAARSSPKDADAAYNLALVRRELGKTPAALIGVKAALAARPEFPEAENLLGVLLSQSGQLPEARLHLEKATQQAPDFAEAWNNLGYTLLLQGELPAAGAALEKALSLAPDFPDALDNLGITMARQHNLDRAGELFRRALELQPENEQAANNLGVLYAQQGKTQDAVATFRALLQHNPEAPSAALNLAKLELSVHDEAEAKRLLSSWLAKHPEDAAARKLLDRAQVKR